MAASPSQIVLLDPMGIPNELCADSDTTVATASTSKGREVKFWFKKVKVDDIFLLQLHASNLEATPSLYSGYARNYFSEVVCTHKGLVVIRLSSPYMRYPTDYFVYGCRAGGNRGPRVVRLPKIVPEIPSGNPVGMLCADDGNYVVANLRFQVNPQTWQLHAFLHCYYSSRDMVWSQSEVTPLFPDEEKVEHMCKWKTDLIIPFGDSCLLWVDLLRGILLCPNLVDPDCTKKLEYVPLPRELLSAWPESDWRGRPQEFRNLSCINGELKLVDVQRIDDNFVEVAIWALQTDIQSWKKERSFNHPNVRLAVSFPVLSTDESDILYLTVAEDNEARLLRMDMKTCTLKDRGYRRFFNHRNPPYPSQLTKYLDNISTTEILPTTANYPSICTIKEREDNSVHGESAPVDWGVEARLFPPGSSFDQQPGRTVVKCEGQHSQIPDLQPCQVHQISPITSHALSSQLSEHRQLDLSTLVTGIPQSLKMDPVQFAQPNFLRHRPFEIQPPLAGLSPALPTPGTQWFNYCNNNTSHRSQFSLPYQNELLGSSVQFTRASEGQNFQPDTGRSVFLMALFTAMNVYNRLFRPQQ